MSGGRDGSFVSEFIEGVDDILAIRDEMGAYISNVWQVTRYWSGETVGEGTMSETRDKIYPTPWLVDFSHDVRVVEAGAIKMGDILLKGISKKSYPNETDVDCSSDDKNVEKFYLVNAKVYRVVNVKENYATWNVLLRRLADQTGYDTP